MLAGLRFRGELRGDCYVASVNPEFGTTLALQSNLIAIKFGTAEARRLNWALFIGRILTLILQVLSNTDQGELVLSQNFPKHLYSLVSRVSLLHVPWSDPGNEVGIYSDSP